MSVNRSLLIFENSLKSKVTVKDYTRQLNKFKLFASDEMNVELDYDSLSAIQSDKLQILVEDYIMNIKRTVNPNSIPTYYHPIKPLLAKLTDNTNKKLTRSETLQLKKLGSEGDLSNAAFELSPVDPELMAMLMPVLLIMTSVISGFAIKVIQGGMYKTVFFHIGLLMVIGGVSMFAVSLFMEEFLNGIVFTAPVPGI